MLMPLVMDLTQFRKRMGRFSKNLRTGIPVAADTAAARFQATWGPRRLQKRGKASIGPRSRKLIEGLIREVKKKGQNTTAVRLGWRDSKLNMIAVIQERPQGTTIRPKNKPFLKFKLFRKFHNPSRGAWPFPGPEQWIATKSVFVLGRMNMRNDFVAFRPQVKAIMFGSVVDAARKAFS